jgi:hypothetical protein
LEEKRKLKSKAHYERKVIMIIMGLYARLWLIFHSQVATAKHRTKALQGQAASYEKLTALGY